MQNGSNSAQDVRNWQRCNMRNPPSWGPEVQHAYSFRHWLLDLMAWSVFTDIQEARKGPAVELVLSGTARDLIREIPIDVKTIGRVFDFGDGVGAIHRPGLDYIIYVLTLHFAHLDEEETPRQLM